MAQAARLSLRMQKELRLLLSDPPPGATFPSLSADFDLASLSSIDAQIEGPEGTVYSKGIFKIKIQIPERYPFQPPIVTFATPIYHPNIDNGGRICLDILNLPPKGSWQPSLNVSTVLTSIRLLLSEPNPDDGLMLEASREYKYNRQDFDLKARSMTEKFANGGAGENSCSNQSTQPTPNASLLESRDLMKKYASVGDKRPSGTTKTLSLEPSDSISNGASKFEANEIPKQPLYAFGSENVTGDKGKRKVATGVLEDNNLGYSKLKGARRKLSLASSGQLQKDNDDNKENIDPNCPPSFCPPQAISVGFSSLVLQDTTNGDKRLNDYQNGWKQCQKQTEVSPALLQPSDGKDENILLSNQPGSQPIKPQRGSSVLMSAGTNSKTSSLAGKKKLALGLKATSDMSTLLKPKSTHNKTGLSNTALLPQQENGSHSRTLSPDNLSVDECKCLPTHADHRHNGKQQSDKEQNKKMGEETKQKATELEEEEFPVPESTIVLDSEESEEEERGSSRLRLSIGRKGIVKQRAKT